MVRQEDGLSGASIADRRLPAAEEADLSAEDFARYFGSAGKAPDRDAMLERAADVFDRVRDG